ncbi:GNAT family N-acetyltransferase [Abyssisolibacter fermentans]|uniref:GNAT family N-acetyltransferase n=1 Tax=Abyssisolibacter fermentans TaxID=1766203 RepID=UPI00082A2D2E|nr:GNAT family protein [Abyssisolibacter fermentans]
MLYVQPIIIQINQGLRLKKTEQSEWEKALKWYQNKKVMYFSEGVTDKVYTMNEINRMYTYLDKIGELYFIEVFKDNKWKAIGDVTLSDKNMPIVIGDEDYWGKGIGNEVIKKLLQRAKDIGMKKIEIQTIYHYNERSKNLFTSLGFKKNKENEKGCSYILVL